MLQPRTQNGTGTVGAMLALAAAAFLLACAGGEPASEPRAPAPPTAPSGTSDRLGIVDRAIEHHGGDLFESSRVRLTVASRSGSFDVDSTKDGDRFEYVIRASAGDDEREYRRDNAALEVTEGDEPMEMDETEHARAESYVNQRMYFLFLPYKLNDPGTYKEDQGLEEWNGRQLSRVRVTFEPGSSDGADSAYVYWFDPETARLEQFAYDYSRGTGLRFRILRNYRRIGGLLFYDADNYGLNTRDGGLTVDDITPAYVAEELPLVSQIELRDIDVERLAK
ncbi:MAG: hypothetical protein F4X59_06550 [Holophagales bacterium]|nr:hypothetical protein [Holophagales bacterium]MXX61447.1 hypothetical protein [Holophagales bacterium]MYC09778.1 hypothetical protein [Holophagales bacterium]MYD24012.1 hypothetical protein [Holophagales bacterium]MYI32935.1 hypothetical protein [Holophagales bacterium]